MPRWTHLPLKFYMSDDAQAVTAILGSRLLTAAKENEKIRSSPASSGSAAIDRRVLDGGFRYGEISLVSGLSGTGKTLITYHAIASHLLNDGCGEAAVIDTTGSFSPLRLRDVLIFRLEAQWQHLAYQHSGCMYEGTASRNDDKLVQSTAKATSMLDRVKVMRVFDFAGVVEAVGEIREMRERTSLKTNASATIATKGRGEVHDSEEESDDEAEPPAGKAEKTNESSDENIGMIIIDTFTNVTSSILSQSQVNGQALLASFMRSFNHLTTYYRICTILVNGIVGVSSRRGTSYQQQAEEHVSIFTSTLGKPALGKTFTYLIDTSILISTLPKTTKDASIAFGSNFDSSFGKALVIEVIKDKRGAREGRWAAFEVVDDVKLVPFPR